MERLNNMGQAQYGPLTWKEEKVGEQQFVFTLTIAGKEFRSQVWKSKKEAKKDCAKKALEELEGDPSVAES